MVEKVVVMNCHVQQKVKVGKTVCDEASVCMCQCYYVSTQVTYQCQDVPLHYYNGVRQMVQETVVSQFSIK